MNSFFRQVSCSLFFGGLVFFAQAQQRYVFTQPKMGSPFTIILYTSDSLTAASLAEQAFSLVDDYVQIYSDYIDSSELNRLCARAGAGAQPVQVSAPMYDILLRSKKAFELSRGKFDITMGPVTRLWRQARKQLRFPQPAEVIARLALTGFNKIVFDTVQRTVRLTQAGMQLDLGGIAQGYIAQKVADFLRQKKIENALIDVSGDIVAIGSPPATPGWTIGVNLPEFRRNNAIYLAH